MKSKLFPGERLLVTAAVVAMSAFLFIYVNDANARLVASGRPLTHLKSWLDDYVPFVPSFVFFYYLYYLWVLLAVPLANTRQQFYHLAGAFCVLQAAAITTFLVLPSHMVRPDVVGSGIVPTMVRWIYEVDPGYNLLPSLHVGHSVLVALAYRTYKPGYFKIIAAGTVGICMSTVLIKQHYLIDLPFGFLFSVAAFYITAPFTQPEKVGSMERASGSRAHQ